MKIILKNLKQVQYIVEIESEKNTIKDLKNEIEKVHGFDSNVIKLLHNGRVLEDTKTLEEYQIKNENVIIMMNTKPKQKQESTQPPNVPKVEDSKKEEPPKKVEEPPKPSYTDQINSLVEMGYEKDKVEKALNAAQGNINIAIEFLSSGNIPESPSTGSQPPIQQNQQGQQSQSTSNLPLELKRNASLFKILCKDQPEKIIYILNDLKNKNPALMEKIKEHEEAFKNYLISPISQEDIDNVKLLEGDLRGEGRRRPGQVEIRLTPEEAAAVQRLKDLGNFSQEEVLQAYIACDKNEELAANYLFEQKLRDEEEDRRNNNNNNNQNQ